jgi:uncharacterized protein (DUF2236 family)
MGDAGLFGPGSLTWRVNREGVLLLGGGRALLLQVAHPLVAAGVAEHSNYREDPFGASTARSTRSRPSSSARRTRPARRWGASIAFTRV